MRSLLWIVITIIVYGSLYPFHFIWVDPAQIDWLEWSVQIRQRTTNGDLLSNILTFVPLGYFAYAVDASEGTTNYRKISWILICGGFFAFILQVVQFFTPTRIPSVGDAVFNLLGLLLGCMTAFGVQWWLRRNPQLALQWPQQISVPLLLAIFWLVYQLFPFAPNFAWNSMQQNWSPLFSEPYFEWSRWLFESVMWYCFVILLLRMSGFSLSNNKIASIVIGIFVCKIFIAFNRIQITNIVAAGMAILLLYQSNNREWNRWHFFAIGFAIFMREMSPFNVADKVLSFNFIPFRHYLSGSMWTNTQLILEKLFAYGVLIYSAIEWLGDRFKAINVCLGFVLIIELLQLVWSQNHADITDILLVSIIGYGIEQIRQAKMV